MNHSLNRKINMICFLYTIGMMLFSLSIIANILDYKGISAILGIFCILHIAAALISPFYIQDFLPADDHDEKETHVNKSDKSRPSFSEYFNES